MDVAAVEWRSGMHPTLKVFDKLVNLWWTCNVSTCRNFFFLLRVNWDMTFSDGVLSLYSFSLPGFLFFKCFPYQEHLSTRTLPSQSAPFSFLYVFRTFSVVMWVFPHSSLNLGLCRAFLRGHLWVYLSRSVLSAYEYNLVFLCHHQISSPPPQILHRTCLLALCWLPAFLIIAVLIKFSADSTES